MSQPENERRRCFRAKLSVPIKFKLCTELTCSSYEGITHNVSSGGLLIEMSRHDAEEVWTHIIPQKTKLIIEELFISKLFTEMMTVVDVRWKNITNGVEHYFVGVSFVDASVHRTSIIAQFLGLC